MANSANFEQDGFVSVWAGHINSRDEFDTFFEEQIGEDDTIDIPLNKFAGSVGIGFYDHDFQEAEFNEDGAASLRTMLEPLSYSSSYIDKAEAAAKGINLGDVNTVVSLYDFKYEGNVKADAPIKLVGVFPFDKTAD